MRVKATAALAVLCAGLLAHNTAWSDQTATEGNPNWGTIASPDGLDDSVATASLATAAITPASSFTEAQYGSGGVGLRNLGTGVLHISGVLAPVKAAYLYWAVITQGAAPGADKTVALTPLSPAGTKAIALTGSVIGTGSSPCWPGNTISVFRAVVPPAKVAGNGLYQVAFTAKGASGSTAGQDPWLTSPLPSLEGASLVVIGTGTGIVTVFDKGFAGHTFGKKSNPETFSYSLTLPKATNGHQVLFESIGADGQIGSSRTAGNAKNSQPYLAAKATEINKQVIAGPFNYTYIDYDSDWNGNAAAPLPRLWDDVGHDITAAAPSGTKKLDVSIVTQGDCLTPVANIVAAF